MLVVDDKFDFALDGYTKEPNADLVGKGIGFRQNDIKRMDENDQAIQTILLGLPEDVYAAVDGCETAKEIWERVR
nr:ribonuclease H-like domain-containing protein [Tanacetum cinerariifolium]